MFDYILLIGHCIGIKTDICLNYSTAQLNYKNIDIAWQHAHNSVIHINVTPVMMRNNAC